jgi:RNA polymerase sigma-70 factor, ECF subfamily
VDNPQFDTTLFNGVRRNDRLALNTLFTRYYSRLCAFANSYVQSKDDAEEIVSDVFVNLWKGRHSIKINSSFRAYLYVSVKHAAFAKMKKRQVDMVSIDDLLMEHQFIDDYGPLEALAFNEMENHLQGAINGLPPRCRQVFLMKWTEGLTYKEIGEILGVAEKTVENQVIKAFVLIRTSIRKFQSAL